MIMDMGILYAVVAFCCMIVCSIILNRTKTTQYKETVDNKFCLMLIFFLLFCLVDAIWGVLTSTSLPRSQIAYTISTYGFHSMAALSAFIWAGYLLHYMKIESRQKKIVNILRGILITVQASLLISNIWTRYAFYIDENSNYIVGFLRNYMFFIQFSYYFILFVCAVVNQAKCHDSRAIGSAVLFSLIPIIFGFLQMLFPDAPMYSIGFMVSSVAIYSFNVTSMREEYLTALMKSENDKLSSIIAGLSDDFQTIYYIDLNTGKYESYGESILHCNQKNILISGNDFFEDNLNNLEKKIYFEDIELVRNMLTKEHIEKELETKKSFTFNYRRILQDEVRYYSLKVIRSEISENKNFVIIGVFDADDRVREEMKYNEQLRMATEQAELANQAKTTFLFNMSHDIRTPMNAVLGFTDMALKNTDDSQKVSSYLNKVKNAGNHLLSIINDILDMSRIENNKITLEENPVSFSKLSTGIIDIVKPLADAKNISLSPAPGFSYSDFGLIFADEQHLSRIFINIFTNAVKYTRPGGHILYSAKELPSDREGYLNVEFTIKDNGIGMSREFLEHIYEIFSRERNSTTSGIQGTGLGMAIVKSLVDLMNGDIEIQSEPEVGTTVIIRLPFRKCNELPHSSEPSDELVQDVSLAGKKILLVEDNELNREIASDILFDFSVIITEAENGEIAVEKCKASLADEASCFDIILMDVQMPIMNGYDATEEIRTLPEPYASKIPIIAMTANVSEDDVKRAFASGMNAYLSKPINISEFTQTLQKFSNQANS